MRGRAWVGTLFPVCSLSVNDLGRGREVEAVCDGIQREGSLAHQKRKWITQRRVRKGFRARAMHATNMYMLQIYR